MVVIREVPCRSNPDQRPEVIGKEEREIERERKIAWKGDVRGLVSLRFTICS